MSSDNKNLQTTATSDIQSVDESTKTTIASSDSQNREVVGATPSQFTLITRKKGQSSETRTEKITNHVTTLALDGLESWTITTDEGTRVVVKLSRVGRKPVGIESVEVETYP
jgi:hypothetical protein